MNPLNPFGIIWFPLGAIFGMLIGYLIYDYAFSKVKKKYLDRIEGYKKELNEYKIFD